MKNVDFYLINHWTNLFKVYWGFALLNFSYEHIIRYQRKVDIYSITFCNFQFILEITRE